MTDKETLSGIVELLTKADNELRKAQKEALGTEYESDISQLREKVLDKQTEIANHRDSLKD